MAITESVQKIETPAIAVTKAKATTRQFFIDHWRAGLAILVVLHHVALVYGASTPFYYMEPPFTEPLTFLALLVFVLLNQAWFMGAFFLLAGYFTPGSYNRKGAGQFLLSRITRLGIPLLLFYFVLGPIAGIGFFLMPPELTGITNPLSWTAYPGLVGLGPLWFVAMLLVFNIGYVGWRMVTGSRVSSPDKNSSVPGYLSIGLFALALAGASYVMRMYIPLGQAIGDFPTLAYLPQYLSFFIVGAMASRGDWLRRLSASKGIAGFVIAAVAVVVLFPLAFSGQWFSLEVSSALDNAMGNGHWQSAVYVLFDSFFAIGLCLGMVILFRRLFNKESRLGKFLAQQSYAVYILHIPIIVFIGYAMRSIQLGSLAKFGLAAVIIIPVCFVIAYLVRRIPLLSKVL
jgi:peptidoglycan/LPS O-acetylase OafA/YrhL